MAALLLDAGARADTGKMTRRLINYWPCCCYGMAESKFEDSSVRLLMQYAREEKGKKKEGQAYKLLRQIESQNKELIVDYTTKDADGNVCELAGTDHVKDRVCWELLRLDDKQLLEDFLRKGHLRASSRLACVAVEHHVSDEVLATITCYTGKFETKLLYERVCKLVKTARPSTSKILIDYILRDKPDALSRLLEIAALERRDPDLTAYVLGKSPPAVDVTRIAALVRSRAIARQFLEFLGTHSSGSGSDALACVAPEPDK